MNNQKSKLTFSDIHVGDRVKVVSSVVDFYFFEENLGTVEEITKGYLGVIVRMDNADPQATFNFNPENLEVVQKLVPEEEDEKAQNTIVWDDEAISNARQRAIMAAMVDTKTFLSLLDIFERFSKDLEQTRVQLAGCSVAAKGFSNQQATQGQYGWSASYQDVLDLRAAYDKTRRELAEMRERERWIPVKERLPEFVDQGAYYATDTVLVDWQYQDVASNIERDVCKAGLVADDPMIWVNEENGERYELDDPDAPTRWRPLPAPPEEK